jgi:hypothetical protein
VTALSLSGYLPGDETNGLSRLAGQLAAAAERSYQTGEEREQVVIIGVIHPVSVRHKLGGDDEQNPAATVEVRFVSIEAVQGPEADQVRSMIVRLRETRTQVQPIPGIEGDATTYDPNVGYSVGDLPPMRVAEPERPTKGRGKGKGGLAAVPDPFDAGNGEDGEYVTPDDEPPEAD